jgi:LAO/AO transport system kinase
VVYLCYFLLYCIEFTIFTKIKLVLSKSNKISALTEKDGIEAPKIFHETNMATIRNKRKNTPSPEALLQGILQNDIVALSRGITLVESTNTEHFSFANTLIQDSLQHAKKSIRIGITGVPGAGKSTFIESFGTFITSLGLKVAVLAIDPSSNISKGSILGDKTRMEELVKNPNAYIRPSAAGENLGGVAQKTRESIILCEAFGFDVIIVETVGVGQNETAVHKMVDFFLLLQIAGAGDGLQGIKRGIMEMADLIIINKADGNNINATDLAKVELQRALHFFPPKNSGWVAEVQTCSALYQKNIDTIWQTINNYLETTQQNQYFTQNRTKQNEYWFEETVKNTLLHHFYQDPSKQEQFKQLKEQIAQNKISPFAAAKELMGR